MTTDVYENDGKGRANFYAHKHPVFTEDREFRASVYRVKYNPMPAIPANFIGRRALRPPTDDDKAYSPVHFDGRPGNPPEAMMTPRMPAFTILPRFQ